MRIERGDLADAGMVRACHEVYDAALRADKAEGPWLTAGPFSGWLSVGWMGDPREVWLVTDQAAGGGAAAGGGGAREGGRFTGAVAGWYRLELPDRENLDRAQLDLMVHPDRRRRGLGRMLLQHAATRAAAHGRSVLSGAAQHGSAPEIWDAQRVRERINHLLPRFGMRHYSLAARHDASGELAALTQIGVHPDDPSWGHQLITVVIRKHRGHRLGLLMKTAMLERLATTEPQLERISTWNAEANQHMIAVNQAIGYATLGPPNTFWRLDVPRSLG